MTQQACDSCGRPADAVHMQRRIRRLELATSFRPIRIGVLLMHPAPASPLEDFFYAAAHSHETRSAASRAFFNGLIHAAGIPVTDGMDDASALADFQRRGFFLASVSECPLTLDAGAVTIEAFAATLIKRIQFSYKPKYIALLSQEMRPLIPHLGKATLTAQLVLWKSGPLPDPADAFFLKAAAECFSPLLASLHP